MTTLEQLLSIQKELIADYFARLDVREVGHVAARIENITGLLVFTGVGKSGIIAEKIAMTLVSTGTRALFLPAGNFLHGDLGILTEKDALVVLSRSGETQELLDLLPFVKKKGAMTIAVVSKRDSRLTKLCDEKVVLPMERELCPFNLAPTISTTVQLLFGDLLAVYLMKSKNVALTTYAENHPGGILGKTATLRVDDLMWQGDVVPCASPGDRLIDVLVELTNKKCGALLITDKEKRLQGIFTDGDLRRSLQRHGSKALELTMEVLMTANPLFIQSGARAIEALQTMQNNPKRYVMVLPVVARDRVVGVVRMHDIVQAGIG